MIHFDFIKSNRYYYDPNNKTIHGKVYQSRKYYHEEFHAICYENKLFKRFALFMDKYLQISAMILTPLYFIKYHHGLTIYALLGICILPYYMFRFLEELSADIYSLIKIRTKR